MEIIAKKNYLEFINKRQTYAIKITNKREIYRKKNLPLHQMKSQIINFIRNRLKYI